MEIIPENRDRECIISKGSMDKGLEEVVVKNNFDCSFDRKERDSGWREEISLRNGKRKV